MAIMRQTLIYLNRGITKHMHVLEDIIDNSVKEGRIKGQEEWLRKTVKALLL